MGKSDIPEKKIVLLIDAENTSAKYADGIEEYISSKGDIISAQLYGDFIDNKNTKQWNGKAIEYNLQRYQADTTKAGKNAADIALVIDAMDFLYKENPADIFCIVTSDGDFTSLVERIRKEGITVIGMGKADASPRLRRACSEYVELEGLVKEKDASDESGSEKKTSDKKTADKKTAGKKTAGKKETSKKDNSKKENSKKDNSKKETGKKESGKKDNIKKVYTNKEVNKSDNDKKDKLVPLKNIKMVLNQLVQQDENQGKLADLGGIKSRLQLKFSGFDERSYGYKSIRELIDKETKFLVVQEGNQAYVISQKRGKNQNNVKVEESILEQVCEFILDSYPDKTIGKNEVGALGRKLKGQFKDFDYKNFGYSKLSFFLNEIGMELK